MKKSRVINIGLFVSLIMVLLSCTKEIPFSAEERASQIVINSLFTNDTIWMAYISRSASILDEADYSPLENAQVNVYNSAHNLVATLSHQENGVYTDSTQSPEPNQEYTIEVSVPNYTSVSATDILPTPVPIVEIDTLSTTDAEGMTRLQVSLTFDDPAGAENYYMVEMRVSGEYDSFEEYGRSITGKGERFDFRQSIISNDPNVESVNGFSLGGFENTYEYLLLSDRRFNGQTYTLSFSVINWQDVKGEGIDLRGDMRLLNTSKAFFNYRISYEQYSNSNGNPFAQPTQVYSNVNDGIGIFAGGTLTTWAIDF